MFQRKPALRFYSDALPKLFDINLGKKIGRCVAIAAEGFTVEKVRVTTLKTNMAMENHNFGYEIHLHSWLVFHCHVHFRGCIQHTATRSDKQAPPNEDKQQTLHFTGGLEDTLLFFGGVPLCIASCMRIFLHIYTRIC